MKQSRIDKKLKKLNVLISTLNRISSISLSRSFQNLIKLICDPFQVAQNARIVFHWYSNVYFLYVDRVLTFWKINWGAHLWDYVICWSLCRYLLSHIRLLLGVLGLDLGILNHRMTLFSLSGGFSFGSFRIFSFWLKSLTANQFILAQKLLYASLSTNLTLLFWYCSSIMTHIDFRGFRLILRQLSTSLFDLWYDLLLTGMMVVWWFWRKFLHRKLTLFRLFSGERISPKRLTHTKSLIFVRISTMFVMFSTQTYKVFFGALSHLLKSSRSLVVLVI